MKNAKLLLERLTEMIPPGDKQHHNLIVEDGNLILTLMCGDKYHPIRLEDIDFGKTVKQLANEIEISLIAHLTS